MSDTVSMRTLKRTLMSPQYNPFGQMTEVVTKNKHRVIPSANTPLLDPLNGQVTHTRSIHKIVPVDDAQFVKVFAAGIAASYELTKTAQKVFMAILSEYERTPMQHGFADTIELYWYGDGIEGKDVGMSERTFQRGLRELIKYHFLHPRKGNSYWVNPALFFKGDRMLFIKEYRRSIPKYEMKNITLEGEIVKTDLEGKKGLLK